MDWKCNDTYKRVLVSFGLIERGLQWSAVVGGAIAVDCLHFLATVSVEMAISSCEVLSPECVPEAFC